MVKPEDIIIQVDMDGVIVDYAAAYARYLRDFPIIKYPQSFPGFFLNLEPMRNAIQTLTCFRDSWGFDVRILTAPSNKNPSSYTEKALWVEKNLGYSWLENLTLSSRKEAVDGDYLIDDKYDSHGQNKFKGKLLQFGTEEYKDWDFIYNYFEKTYRND